nr:hypothetical protein [Tanacetum cinerariifolium]
MPDDGKPWSIEHEMKAYETVSSTHNLTIGPMVILKKIKNLYAIRRTISRTIHRTCPLKHKAYATATQPLESKPLFLFISRKVMKACSLGTRKLRWRKR